MENRIIIRIMFEKLTLKEAAELEEALRALLDEYGKYELEINSLAGPILLSPE